MAATLALVAAFLFALAATLQQKGTLDLPTISLAHPMSLVRLVGQTTWLIGTLVLFAGYAVPGRCARPWPALDHPAVARHDGRLRAAARLLPDRPARRSTGGDRRGRDPDRPRPVRVLRRPGRWEHERLEHPVGDHDRPAGAAVRRAARPRQRRRPVEEGGGVRHRGRHPVRALVVPDASPPSTTSTRASARCSPTGSATRSRRPRVLGFVLQQVSLGTGRLAPAVATVSVANPIVGILIGVILLDERLSEPTWHILLAAGRPGPRPRRCRRHLARARDPTRPPTRTRRTRPSDGPSRDLRRRRGPLLRARCGRQRPRAGRDIRRHPQRATAHERDRLPERLRVRNRDRLWPRPGPRSGRRRPVRLARRRSRRWPRSASAWPCLRSGSRPGGRGRPDRRRGAVVRRRSSAGSAT